MKRSCTRRLPRKQISRVVPPPKGCDENHVTSLTDEPQTDTDASEGQRLPNALRRRRVPHVVPEDVRRGVEEGRVGGFERIPAEDGLQSMPNTAALRAGVAGFEPATPSSRMKRATKAFGGNGLIG